MSQTTAFCDGLAPSATTITEITLAEWYSLLASFDDVSIYQTRAYGSCHWSQNQLSSLALQCRGKVVAMAQVRVVRVPFLRKGLAYIRWGPLCRLKGEPFNEQRLRLITSALKEEYVHRRGLLLRVLPPVFHSDAYSEVFQSAWAELGLQPKRQQRLFRTIRLDLSPSLENLRRGLNGKWRNMLNSSERNGLTISEGADVDSYDRFLAAYREMMTRKRFETTVDVGEFRNMQRELPAPFKMQTFLCLKDGKVLNALVLSALGDTAIYLLGATSDEGLKLKGAYLLQWRAIQWLKERGCRWYDLGGVDPVRNPGVYHFKQGFGGQETEHLGAFEASPGPASTLCVTAGEHLLPLALRLKSLLGPRNTAGKARL